MIKILVSGSRDADPEMYGQADALIQVLLKKAGEFEIIVGDASGIDKHIMDSCNELGIVHHVFGAYGKMRNVTKTSINHVTYGTYLQRDRWMAGLCDRCYAIWNGVSGGTIFTYKVVREMEKIAHLFNKETNKWQ